jgi:hypothetical protein
MYPNREVATREAVPGREHCNLQTEDFVERLNDNGPQSDLQIATDFYMDRPPNLLFSPKKPAKECCKAQQIYEGDA